VDFRTTAGQENGATSRIPGIKVTSFFDELNVFLNFFHKNQCQAGNSADGTHI